MKVQSIRLLLTVAIAGASLAASLVISGGGAPADGPRARAAPVERPAAASPATSRHDANGAGHPKSAPGARITT